MLSLFVLLMGWHAAPAPAPVLSVRSGFGTAAEGPASPPSIGAAFLPAAGSLSRAPEWLSDGRRATPFFREVRAEEWVNVSAPLGTSPEVLRAAAWLDALPVRIDAAGGAVHVAFRFRAP